MQDRLPTDSIDDDGDGLESSFATVSDDNAGQLSPKVFIKTFGCQMNVYDSERMIEALAPVGYDETNDMSEADLVVLNTCHIREKAAEKVYSELGRVRQARDERRRAGKTTTVAVAGCVAQAEGNSQVVWINFLPYSQQHQRKAIDSVSRLAITGLEAGAGQGKIRAVGQRVAVHEHQSPGLN